MCGRYRRTTSAEELARRYYNPIPPQRDLLISWNIAPTQDVFASGEKGESRPSYFSDVGYYVLTSTIQLTKSSLSFSL